ncbi:MAG: thioredoxin domain-containing protein, partial [Actinobacteria bacterium]|nr:thioredoxin domain-containing protein [Actinomycetota bacterium]
AATLEDYGDLAVGLLELAVTTGEAQWAVEARALVDACIVPAAEASPGESLVRPPGGEDPTLLAHGLATVDDPQEGAAPSGTAALARAALLLHQLTAEARYRALAEALIAPLGPLAVPRPIGFGATLGVASALAQPSRQLVVVSAEAAADELVAHARRADASGTLAIAMTADQAEAWARCGFALLADRHLLDGRTTAYLCTDFVCRLPVTSLSELTRAGELGE